MTFYFYTIIWTLSKPTIKVLAGGLDHSYVLRREETVGSKELILAGILEVEDLSLACYTTQDILHVHTGNFLRAEGGKKGTNYDTYSGLCLEVQGYPDSLNQAAFPTSVIGSGEDYDQQCIYRVFQKHSGE